jgi:pyridoxal phosphate enzyme (YggS family)
MSNRRQELEVNLRSVEAEIAAYAPTLIVVTKTYPISDVEILSSLGAKNFGENRSDEGLAKSQVVDAHWHYQGAIQSKKINEIVTWADCIHSLDDSGHLTKLSRKLEVAGTTIEVFLQLSLDGNSERGGVQEAEIRALAEACMESSHMKLLGIMCVPPVEMDLKVAFSEISHAHQRFIADFPSAPYLSAGMSGDYMVALDHGATHIRVGSKILGARQYD